MVMAVFGLRSSQVQGMTLALMAGFSAAEMADATTDELRAFCGRVF